MCRGLMAGKRRAPEMAEEEGGAEEEQGEYNKEGPDLVSQSSELTGTSCPIPIRMHTAICVASLRLAA
jgi:hypothetical protein